MLNRPDITTKANFRRHALEPEKYQYMGIQLAWESWQECATRKSAELAAVNEIAIEVYNAFVDDGFYGPYVLGGDLYNRFEIAMNNTIKGKLS